MKLIKLFKAYGEKEVWVSTAAIKSILPARFGEQGLRSPRGSLVKFIDGTSEEVFDSPEEIALKIDGV